MQFLPIYGTMVHEVATVLTLHKPHFKHDHTHRKHITAKLVNGMRWLSMPLFQGMA